MSEYIKNLMNRWYGFFSKRFEFEKSRSGFNSQTAKLAVLAELAKEQVPYESASTTARQIG